MKKILVASNNVGKLRELTEIFEEHEIEIIPQSVYQVPGVEENGASFIENALLKARNACCYTGLPVIGEDSGLCIESLNGEPGIFSARYAGASQGDAANRKLVLKKLEHHKNREAYFYCAMVLIVGVNDPLPLIGQGFWHGLITKHEIGLGGFGYDSIFFDQKMGRTAAELTLSEKNKISHRTIASKNLVDQYLREKK